MYIFKDKGHIAFVNETLGETWFELVLTSEENLPVKLPVLRAELGKIEKAVVTLENPLSREVKVTSNITNHANFEISNDKFVIPGNSSIDIDIRYIPSN